MKQIELNRMGLTPINDLEMNEINGGGLWFFNERVGYIAGYIFGATLRITQEIAQRILEHEATR